LGTSASDFWIDYNFSDGVLPVHDTHVRPRWLQIRIQAQLLIADSATDIYITSNNNALLHNSLILSPHFPFPSLLGSLPSRPSPRACAPARDFTALSSPALCIRRFLFHIQRMKIFHVHHDSNILAASGPAPNVCSSPLPSKFYPDTTPHAIALFQNKSPIPNAGYHSACGTPHGRKAKPRSLSVDFYRRSRDGDESSAKQISLLHVVGIFPMEKQGPHCKPWCWKVVAAKPPWKFHGYPSRNPQANNSARKVGLPECFWLLSAEAWRAKIVLEEDCILQ
jgi:hypothetical protein